MPKVKIVDGPRSVEIEDENQGAGLLLILAAEALDSHQANMSWAPDIESMEEALANV